MTIGQANELERLQVMARAVSEWCEAWRADPLAPRKYDLTLYRVISTLGLDAMTSRGSVRPEAGCTPEPDATVATAFVITQRQAAWLDAQTINSGDSKSANIKSELVRRALDIFIQMSR